MEKGRLEGLTRTVFKFCRLKILLRFRTTAAVRQRDAEYNFLNMGRFIGPKNKIARRFGVNLGLKTNAAKVAKRLSQPPGVHGPGKRPKAATGFGKQLLEKQKARIVYGIRERQFRSYVDKATTLKGDSSVNLQIMLEMRLDNVVYRLGFAVTRAQARQMVSHKMFKVNGKPLKCSFPCFKSRR